MSLHQASDEVRLGVALATLTMLMWGTLPVALAILIERLDAETLVWFRFVVSSLMLGALLAFRGGLPAPRDLGRRGSGLLVVAVLGLTANYVLFMHELDLTTPANAQVLIQVGPLLLAVGGLVIFRERFNRMQWTGFAVLIAGLGIFFSDQLLALIESAERYLFGCAVMVAAALTWAVSKAAPHPPTVADTDAMHLHWLRALPDTARTAAADRWAHGLPARAALLLRTQHDTRLRSLRGRARASRGVESQCGHRPVTGGELCLYRDDPRVSAGAHCRRAFFGSDAARSRRRRGGLDLDIAGLRAVVKSSS